MDTGMNEHESLLVTTAAFADGIERLTRSGRLFAAVDAADAPFVAEKATQAGPHAAVCLYKPKDASEWADAAPYLFQVDPSTWSWLRDGLTEDPSLCVFAIADTNLEGVRRHFRRYLLVQSPAGTKMNFRFYDPRVLVTWLDCCTAQELDDFYGPVSEYGIPTEDGLGALFWKRLVEGAPRRREDVLYKLRPAQMRAFSKASEERFTDRTVNFLQTQFPDAREEPRPSLKYFVAEQIDRARTLHGFTTELELVTYVITAWALGGDFDTAMPAVAETLAAKHLSSGDKAAWISDFTRKLLRTLEET
ncbi:DUF4123 domain-containing protein [Polyangium sp. 15x6]|uniref:DUF4123 domain-containing protein n=1 Tax=Polyangium sp. 15x6 TaxID=3042687 RepID=UPI00249A6E4F|nr:DUF4123 domain-containing protein [Polyangium sp. 15x6]MDI3284188.1 DUF4123 domain-containing protein [Polyangium sp. 15x6]